MENGKNFPPDTIPRIEEEKRETGPPPEAPVPVPLTEAQRRFAAQYHALIYGFLLEKKLEIREYYDIAAIGYLHAVQRYFTEKSLHRYRFSTIAWRSMNSSLNTFQRQEQRRQSHEFSYRCGAVPFNFIQGTGGRKMYVLEFRTANRHHTWLRCAICETKAPLERVRRGQPNMTRWRILRLPGTVQAACAKWRSVPLMRYGQKSA